jgi:hypothetical protein
LEHVNGQNAVLTGKWQGVSIAVSFSASTRKKHGPGEASRGEAEMKCQRIRFLYKVPLRFDNSCAPAFLMPCNSTYLRTYLPACHEMIAYNQMMRFYGDENPAVLHRRTGPPPALPTDTEAEWRLVRSYAVMVAYTLFVVIIKSSGQTLVIL